MFIQYSDVAALLPQRTKDVIESKTNQAKANLKTWNAPNNKSNYMAVAIGSILGLAGIFLILAAHRILPHRINAISKLGIGGRIAGYGSLGLGFVIALVGAVKRYLNKQNAHVNSEPDVSGTHHTAEFAEIDSYFPYKLLGDEIFVMDNPSREEVTVFYTSWNDQLQYHCPMKPAPLGYHNSTAETVFQNWRNSNLDIENSLFVDLTTMQQRVQAFEAHRA